MNTRTSQPQGEKAHRGYGKKKHTRNIKMQMSNQNENTTVNVFSCNMLLMDLRQQGHHYS